MEKCLVTKLNGSVSNTDLLKLGEIRFPFTEIANPTANKLKITLAFSKDAKVTVDGNGYFTDQNLSANNGKEVNFVAGAEKSVVLANKTCNVSILDKYSLKSINCFSKIAIPLDELAYSTNLTGFSFYDSECYGNISFVKNLKKLDYLDCHNNRNIYGDIAAFSGHKTETVINFYDTNLSGNIESLNGMPLLKEIHLFGTQVGGNIDNLADLPSLEKFLLYNTRILEGNIASLAKFPRISVINVGNNKVTGYVKTLCENLHRNGRTTGTLTVLSSENTVKFDANTAMPSNNKVVATFSASGVTYDGGLS